MDADLLRRMSLVPAGEANPGGLRVFCGIYTMASNHDSNVQVSLPTFHPSVLMEADHHLHVG
jgi:hypothetical protein